MNIEEAIVILEKIKYDYPPKLFKSKKNALNLGTEALKRFQRYRRDTVNSILDKLPGETE